MLFRSSYRAADGDADSDDASADRHADANGHGDTDRDAITHADGDRNVNGHADADGYAYADTRADPGAALGSGDLPTNVHSPVVRGGAGVFCRHLYLVVVATAALLRLRLCRRSRALCAGLERRDESLRAGWRS